MKTTEPTNVEEIVNEQTAADTEVAVVVAPQTPTNPPIELLDLSFVQEQMMATKAVINVDTRIGIPENKRLNHWSKNVTDNMGRVMGSRPSLFVADNIRVLSVTTPTQDWTAKEITDHHMAVVEIHGSEVASAIQDGKLVPLVDPNGLLQVVHNSNNEANPVTLSIGLQLQKNTSIVALKPFAKSGGVPCGTSKSKKGTAFTDNWKVQVNAIPALDFAMDVFLVIHRMTEEDCQARGYGELKKFVESIPAFLQDDSEAQTTILGNAQTDVNTEQVNALFAD